MFFTKTGIVMVKVPIYFITKQTTNTVYGVRNTVYVMNWLFCHQE